MNTIKQALRRDVLRYINTTNSQIFWQIVQLHSSGMNRLCALLFRYIWTGGRKCNFRGCDRPDLTPNIINGWFWAARRTKIPAKQDCDFCEWSPTGG